MFPDEFTRQTATIHAAADRLLAPLAAAMKAAGEQAAEQVRRVAEARQERLEAVPTSRQRFSLPTDLTF